MMFRKIRIKSLEQTQHEQKVLKKLDEERALVNIDFDLADVGSVEKGELLLKFIKLTEERLKYDNSFSNRKGLTIIKTMYKQGLSFGKWKKPKEEKKIE